MDTINSNQAENVARFFRVLGHPMRIAIIYALNEKPWCVCKLAKHLGMNKSITSKHLSLLKREGIIEMKHEGTNVNCELKMPCVMGILQCVIDKSDVSDELTKKN